MQANRDVVSILQQALTLLQEASSPGNVARSTEPTHPATVPTRQFDRVSMGADRSAGTSPSNPRQLQHAAVPGPSSLREMRNVELRRLYAPYRTNNSSSSMPGPSRTPSSTNGGVKESSKRFFLLGSPTETTTPPNARKTMLQNEHLGQQILCIKKTMNTAAIENVVRQAYSRLGNREFELLRASGSGPMKPLCPIVVAQTIPDGRQLIASRVGIFYIRPMSVIIEEDSEDNFQNEGLTFTNADESQTDENNSSDRIGFEESSSAGHTDVCDTGSVDSIDLEEDTRITGDENPTSDFCTIEDFTSDVHRKNPGIQPIFISREDFLDNLLGIYMKDPTLDVLKTTSVIFAGEAGRDVGGLTKEFFDRGHDALLTTKYLGKYVLFDGQDDHKCPSHDNLLLKTGVFQALGKFFAHSFFCTGKSLYGLSRPIVEYLLNEDDEIKDDITVKIEDVPSFETQSILIQIQNWSTENTPDSRILSRIQTEAINCGFTDTISYSNREILKETILLHHILHMRKAQLDAIKKPLRTFGILKFLSPKPYFYDLVFPSLNQRTYNSEQLIDHIDFTGEAKDRIKSLYTAYIRAMDSVTITEFLKCVTSWPYIDGNRITIDIGDHLMFHVSTCLNKISIPVTMEDEEILDYMRSAILVGGFGSV